MVEEEEDGEAELVYGSGLRVTCFMYCFGCNRLAYGFFSGREAAVEAAAASGGGERAEALASLAFACVNFAWSLATSSWDLICFSKGVSLGCDLLGEVVPAAEVGRKGWGMKPREYNEFSFVA